jgi:hypothetical protein
MTNTNTIKILQKCRERLVELGLGSMELGVLSLHEAAKLYGSVINPYIGKAKWLHLTGAKLIVVDTDRVNINDDDFDRSLCHEAYHEEFVIKADFKQTDLLGQQALKFLSEVYVEKCIAKKLADGEMKQWREIIDKLQEHGLNYIIDFNYQGQRERLKPASREEWWTLINLILFIPLNPASFFFQKTGQIAPHFHIQKTHTGAPFSVKLQEFYVWLEENAIKTPNDQLVSATSINAILLQLEKLDGAIPYAS